MDWAASQLCENRKVLCWAEQRELALQAEKGWIKNKKQIDRFKVTFPSLQGKNRGDFFIMLGQVD